MMKKLMIVILTVAGVLAAEAAQCKGMNKNGKRCKREAAENAEYCIGHADQAKPAEEGTAAQKPKDDGTCWAVTGKGTRCKQKKEGESDYCKRHSADKELAKSLKRCRALTWSGSQCERQPEPNRYYCKQHLKLGAAPEEQKQATPENPVKAEKTVKAEKPVKAKKAGKAKKAEKAKPAGE